MDWRRITTTRVEELPGLLERAGRALARDQPNRILRSWLSVAVGSIAGLMLAAWAPQYLTWPWWSDLDAYATIAQGWDAGVRPYRDVVIFNFPGQIYVFWILGKLVGWGHPAVFYAVDVGLLFLFAAGLTGWSRKRFGSALPGLCGLTAFLAYYMGLDYRLVAQRDWHGPLFAVLGLMTAETIPGRKGRLVSAAAFAIGATIRPHVLLFLPVVALAVDGSARRQGDTWKPSARALLEWGLAFAFSLALAFAPLALQGLFDDFVRGVSQAQTSQVYAKRSLAQAMSIVGLELADTRVVLVLVANLLLALRSRTNAQRTAFTWLIGLLLAVVYKPAHPVAHDYLDVPLRLFWSINVAVLVGLILDARPYASWLQVGAIVAVLIMGVRGVPKFCRPWDSLHAIGCLAHGEDPEKPPAGAIDSYRPDKTWAAYSWGEDRGVRAYLRTKTGPNTRVANLLRNPPFLAINGPVGRISPFPAESGILWLWQVNPDLEPQFVQALEHTPDSVVVWVSNEKSFAPQLALPELVRTIERLYVREARFGRIEVWRRKTDISSVTPAQTVSQHRDPQ